MFPGYDSGSSELLLALVEHVVFFQPSLFFKDSDLIFRRRAPAHVSWSMGATRQKWWAIHRGCVSIDRRGGKWAGDVHCVCGRGYTPFVAEEDLEVESDPEDSRPLHYPPEGQRKDEISKDVGMLCSQVAATVKFTKRITDHEIYQTFLWGMCDTNFYIVRGNFPASYIEAAQTLPGPLPSWAAVRVDRTVFHDMKTVDGRREAVRGVMAVLRYLEWRHKHNHMPNVE